MCDTQLETPSESNELDSAIIMRAQVYQTLFMSSLLTIKAGMFTAYYTEQCYLESSLRTQDKLSDG